MASVSNAVSSLSTSKACTRVHICVKQLINVVGMVERIKTGLLALRSLVLHKHWRSIESSTFPSQNKQFLTIIHHVVMSESVAFTLNTCTCC